MSTSHKKQLINNTLWVYAGKIITQILGLFATILVIRKLPVEMYGTYTFLFGLFFVYQLFITSPIKNVILRYVPELSSAGNYKIIRKLIIYSQVFAIVLIAIFSFLLHLFQSQFSDFFNIDNFSIHYKAFVVFVFCYALKVMSETIIASFLKHPLSTKANVLVVVVRASSYIFFLSSITVDLLLYIEAVVSILFLAFVMKGIIAQLGKKATVKDKKSESEPLFKGRVLRFYSLSFFSELGYGIIGKTSDQYIIAAISSPFYVGLYGFALKIFEMFYKVLPFREFESVLKPVFFKRFSNSTDDAEINNFYMFTIKVLIPLFMLPVLYFLIFGKGVIINVFDEKYLPAYWVTCVSLLGLIINGYFYPLNLVIQLKERVEINLYSRVVVVFSIVAGIYFMKLYGIVGVALATVVGELIKNIFMWILLKKYVTIKYPLKIAVKYGLIIFLSLALFMPASNFFKTWYGIIFGSGLFLLFYVILLLNINPFSNKEVGTLKETLNANQKTSSLLKILEPYVSILTINKIK